MRNYKEIPAPGEDELFSPEPEEVVGWVAAIRADNTILSCDEAYLGRVGIDNRYHPTIYAGINQIREAQLNAETSVTYHDVFSFLTRVQSAMIYDNRTWKEAVEIIASQARLSMVQGRSGNSDS